MFPLSSLAGRFALGFGVSALLGWAALRWVGPRGFLDHPDGRKCHKEAVPRTGGLGFILTMLLGLALNWCTLRFTSFQWVALVAMAAIGLADDRFCLRARYKAVVGLSVAMALAYLGATSLSGQHLNVHLLWGDLPDHFGVYFTLLLLFYWCVPQSFNLVDGLNGLAMGYAVIVLVTLGLAGDFHPFTLGAVSGLLVWNWPKARHFLGDCGSMSLGLMLALLVKLAFAHQDPNRILWMFAYPFLDTSMVVAIRVFKGQHPARADRSHLHHLWVDRLHLREEWVTPLLLLQAAGCCLGVIAVGPWKVVPWLFLGGLGLQALVFVFWEVTSFRRLESKRATLTNPNQGLPISQAPSL